MSTVTICRNCEHTDLHSVRVGTEPVGCRTCPCFDYDPMKLDLDQPTIIRSMDEVTDEMVTRLASHLGSTESAVREDVQDFLEEGFGVVLPTLPKPVWTVRHDDGESWDAHDGGGRMRVSFWIGSVPGYEADAEAECRAYVEAKNAARLDDGD